MQIGLDGIYIVGKIKEGKKVRYTCSDGKVRSKEVIVEMIKQGKIINASVQVYQGSTIIRVKDKSMAVKSTNKNNKETSKGKKNAKDKDTLKKKDKSQVKKETKPTKSKAVKDLEITKKEMGRIEKQYANILDCRKIDEKHICVRYASNQNGEKEQTDVIKIDTWSVTTVSNTKIKIDKGIVYGIFKNEIKKQNCRVVTVEWNKYKLKDDTLDTTEIHRQEVNVFCNNVALVDIDKKDKVVLLVSVDGIKTGRVQVLVTDTKAKEIYKASMWKSGMPVIENFNSSIEFIVKEIIKVDDRNQKMVLNIRNKEYAIELVRHC